MLQIINIPTNTVIAEYSTQASANGYLSAIETEPPTHKIVGEPEPEVDLSE
jgi:hypothetical protein